MSDGIVHSSAFRWRRGLNWFPLGVTYALLYMGRYNLTVAQGVLGDFISKADFGNIFGLGTLVYGVAFLVNGPLTDRMGGKKAILIAAAGSGAMNLAMGLYVRSVLLTGSGGEQLPYVLAGLYAVNMYFQSFAAVAIVKVNAHWFHVRERGKFSGIFGIMISSGIFLAFDVNSRLLKATSGMGEGGVDPKWIVFLAPAALLAVAFFVELFLLRDRPGQAGFDDFDTGDASSGEDDAPVDSKKLILRILTNPIILTIAGVEFCTGVLRNGVMHWFRIYAKEQIAGGVGVAEGWQFALDNWGLLLMIAGIIGGTVAGFVSDIFFHSRRAPAAGGLYIVLTVCTVGMWLFLENAWLLVIIVFLMSLCVIGTHGLLSGTATMDFGGRKGAATAVGVIDGFVYLGTAVQSVSLGFITTRNWGMWPIFLVPFGVIGVLLLLRIWHAKPGAKGAH